LDTLLTVPDAPPAAGPDRLLGCTFAGVLVVVLAAAELLLEVALAIP
jgi:hypothetical protein